MRKNKGLGRARFGCTTGGLLAAAVGLLASGGTAMGQLAISNGPIQDPSTGHWYVLLAQGSWDEANATAEFMGGYLAEINSLDENRFINDNVLTLGLTVNHRGWIGLTDRAVEGDFEWSNGDPFDDFFDVQNWIIGEPSDNPGGAFGAGSLPGEDYVEIVGSLDDTDEFRGGWNDATNLGNPGDLNPRYGIVEFDQVVGACTLPDTSCSPMTEADCTAAGGTYGGDFSQCPGPLPDGACCLLDGSCIETTADNCTSMSQVGQGITAIFNDNGSTCASASCLQIIPANDGCANAVDVGPLPAFVSGTTLLSTADNVGTCVTSDTSGGVWYSVVGTGDTLMASTCEDNGGFADYDTKISVFCGGCDAINRVCVTGNDDSCSTPGGHSTVSWCSVAGNTYYILVHGFFATGSFTLAVSDDGAACSGGVECFPPSGACCLPDGTCTEASEAGCGTAGGVWGGAGSTCDTACPTGACCFFDGTCADETEVQCNADGGSWQGAGMACGAGLCPDLRPANDECVNAQAITGTGTFPFDNNYASIGTDIPSCGNINSDLWYCWTAPATGLATATTVGGTSLDTKMAVYDGCSCPPGAELGCNDDSTGLQSTVAFDAVAGNSYMIQLGMYSPTAQGSGTFQITLDIPGACCFNDGSCASLVESECLAQQGVFHGVGTDCSSVECPNLYALDAPIALDYNWNGICHAPDEQGDPDNLNGFRSISDRALLFDNSTPFPVNAAMAYTLVDSPYTLDTVFLGTREFDTVVNGDNTGVLPNWLSGPTIDSATSTVSPGVALDDASQVGMLYECTNGSGSFDVTLGFSDATNVTYTVNAGDWYADNNGVPAAPGMGVASQANLPGPLSGGDGFPATDNEDNAFVSIHALNLVEAVVTRDSLLSGFGFDISGKTLTSVMFSNRSNLNGRVGVYAMSVRNSGAAACPCELDGDDAQVNVFDLLAYLSLWFPQNGTSGMGLSADYNNSGNVDVFDLLDFLSCWFPASAGGPCP